MTPGITIRLLDQPDDLPAVEQLQRVVWTGTETDVIPAHLLLASVRHGGLLLGAFLGEQLVGAVYGFPSIEQVPDGPRPAHHSHILAVHPDHRDLGIGFALKRAQWQMVRQQGLDHVTWTYDPLQSRNARLNIHRLGAVCGTYLHEAYGAMRDGLNLGMPSDRFQVDWWVRTARVERRMQRAGRQSLGLEHYREAGISMLYDVMRNADGWPRPPDSWDPPSGRLALAEIPSDLPALREADPGLARAWRLFTRSVFEDLFARGYLATDFVFERGADGPRSLYVLSHGESRLE